MLDNIAALSADGSRLATEAIPDMADVDKEQARELMRKAASKADRSRGARCMTGARKRGGAEVLFAQAFAALGDLIVKNLPATDRPGE